MNSPPYDLNSKKKWTIDDFDIGGPLGRGKYGNAFLARERKHKAIVCLKHIVADNTEHQIIREIEIMRHLKYYGYFHDEKRLFMILQYASQGELYKILKASGGFDDVKAASVIAQVIEALIFCHYKNVIHRDIKPENILVMLNGQVKLADFGWSVHTPSKKRTTMCGTLDYLCPEMIRCRTYDEKVDNWAVGILSFELIMAYPPFESEERDQTYKKIDKGVVDYPEIISTLARDFISKLLRTEPKLRITLTEARAHMWIKQNNIGPKALQSPDIKN